MLDVEPNKDPNVTMVAEELLRQEIPGLFIEPLPSANLAIGSWLAFRQINFIARLWRAISDTSHCRNCFTPISADEPGRWAKL